MSGSEAGPSGQASEGRAQGGAFSYGRLPDLPSGWLVDAFLTEGDRNYFLGSYTNRLQVTPKPQQ